MSELRETLRKRVLEQMAISNNHQRYIKLASISEGTFDDPMRAFDILIGQDQGSD